MAQERTAIVVVRKDWINACAALVNNGRESSSSGDTHRIIAPVDDVFDHRGLWLAGVKSSVLKSDGSTVSMRLMIPWSAILTVGIVDGGEAQTMGFVANEEMTVFPGTDPSEK